MRVRSAADCRFASFNHDYLGFGKNMFKILFIPAVGFDETNLPKIKPLESLTQIILLLIAVYLG